MTEPSFAHEPTMRGALLTEEEAAELVEAAIIDQGMPEPPPETKVVMRAAVMIIVRTMLARGWRIEPPDQ